ncbi:hypothetical protein D3C83_162520 [compost metagenome]
MHAGLDCTRPERVAVHEYLRAAEARRGQLLVRRVEETAVIHALDLIGNVAAEVVHIDRGVRVGREEVGEA